MSTQGDSTPQRLGRYVDLVLLGKGGMGAVYRARDPELDRDVAIKTMLRPAPELIARFRREAQAVARLQHPNIVQVFDVGEDGEGNPYFVMELLSGSGLDERLRGQGRLSVRETLAIARQAAAGLAAAHQASVIHRDVKPSNLMLTRDGQVKVVDFSIARMQDSLSTMTGAAALMGTPSYMAPEQAMGRTVDHRADIYALGLSMFELIAGRPPYEAEEMVALILKQMQEPLPDLRAIVDDPELTPELVALIERMAAKEPDARPQSMREVLETLDAIAAMGAGQPGPARATAPATVPEVSAERATATPDPAPTARPSKARPLAMAVGLGALAGLVLLGVVAWVTSSSPSGRSPAAQVVALPQVPGPGSATVAVPAATSPPAPHSPPAPVAGPLRVALLKFKNVSGDAGLATLEAGIGETTVTAAVGASSELSVIERADIDSEIAEIDRGSDVHFDKLSVAALGRLQGIELAVQGGFQRAGKQVRVTARVVRVETGEVLDTLMVTRPDADLFALQDEVAAGLKQRLVRMAGARSSGQGHAQGAGR